MLGKQGRNKMSRAVKCRIISIIFFIYICIYHAFFYVGKKTEALILLAAAAGLVISVSIGTWSLDIPKFKKVLFIIAQLIGYFIIYVIWVIIYLVFFSDGFIY